MSHVSNITILNSNYHNNWNPKITWFDVITYVYEGVTISQYQIIGYYLQRT